MTIPKRAAAPTAPMTGFSMACRAAAVRVVAKGAVVVADIPDVNGTFEAPAAFTNMIACVVAAGFGVAVVLAGFKTLYQH
jgi:hypothetical protein